MPPPTRSARRHPAARRRTASASATARRPTCGCSTACRASSPRWTRWSPTCRSSAASPTRPTRRRASDHGRRAQHAGPVLQDLRAVLSHCPVGGGAGLRLLAVEPPQVRPRRPGDPAGRGQTMSVEERDGHSGYLTTGHEWNGIKELNTPVPRLVYLALAVTALFAVVYWVLMPAFPLGSTYTKGTLGADDRAAVTAAVKQAQADRTGWTGLVAAKSYDDVRADPNLMAKVRATGAVLFGDNCAACHQRDAKGGRGFPNLTTRSWLWGGTPDAIAET